MGAITAVFTGSSGTNVQASGPVAHGATVTVCINMSSMFSATYTSSSAIAGSTTDSGNNNIPENGGTPVSQFSYTAPAAGTTDTITVNFTFFGTARTQTITVQLMGAANGPPTTTGTATLIGNQPNVGGSFSLQSPVFTDPDGDTLTFRVRYNTTNTNTIAGSVVTFTIPVGLPSGSNPTISGTGTPGNLNYVAPGPAGVTRYYFVTCQDFTGSGTEVATNTVAITPVAPGGGGTTPGGGTGTYGIQVYDTDGTTTVISPATRYLNRLTDDVTINNVASHTFPIDATGLNSSNSAVVGVGFGSGGHAVAYNGANGITITNRFGGGQTLSGTYFVARF